jgi:hypothetical protein
MHKAPTQALEVSLRQPEVARVAQVEFPVLTVAQVAQAAEAEGIRVVQGVPAHPVKETQVEPESEETLRLAAAGEEVEP